jgi:hypothetical protein
MDKIVQATGSGVEMDPGRCVAGPVDTVSKTLQRLEPTLDPAEVSGDT